MAVQAVATAHYDKVGKDCDAMNIKYFSGPDGRITEQLRKLTKVEGAKLVLLDIPDDGAFYICGPNLSRFQCPLLISSSQMSVTRKRQDSNCKSNCWPKASQFVNTSLLLHKMTTFFDSKT